MVSRVKVSNVRSVDGVDVCDVEFFDTDGSLPKLEGVPCVSVCKFMSGADSAVETELNVGMIQGLSGGSGGAGDESDFHKLIMQGFRDNRLVSDLVDFGFSDDDLKELALMHRDGDKDLKSYIEDLLTDCNFHTESGAFKAGMYDDYLGDGDASAAFCVDDIVLGGPNTRFYYPNMDITDEVMVAVHDCRALDKWAKRHGVHEDSICGVVQVGFNLTLSGLKKLHKRIHDSDSGFMQGMYDRDASKMYGLSAHALRPLAENIGFVAAFDQVISGEVQCDNGRTLEDSIDFNFILIMGHDNAVWDGVTFIALYPLLQNQGEFWFGDSEVLEIYAEELFSVARMAFMQKFGLKGAVLGEGIRGLIDVRGDDGEVIEEREISWA